MQVCYISEALGSPHATGSRDILPHWKAHVHGVENCQNKGSGAPPACREAAEEINAGEASGFVPDFQFP